MLAIREINAELDALLSQRQINEGLKRLQGLEHELTEVSGNELLIGGLMARLAEWVDVGFEDGEYLRKFLHRLGTYSIGVMPLQECLELKLAEGFAAMDAEELNRAIDILDWAVRGQVGVLNPKLEAIGYFWKGRAHRKKGEYDAAMRDIVRARETMVAIQEPKLAAVIQIQEAWLLFQRGARERALQLLELSWLELAHTDDMLSLGNIRSARGRIEQEAGRYKEALQQFEAAVQLYGKRDASHRNLARALVNSATVKRLIGLQLKKRIDARAGRGATKKVDHGVPATGDLARYDQNWREALQQLQRAQRIFEAHQSHGGVASTRLAMGYLYLDNGNAELAGQEGGSAYRLAFDKKDRIHMARARVLQALVENHRVDEQLGEDADVAEYATLARNYAEEASRLAEQTENRRLAAECQVARGMVFGNDYFQEWEAAQRCAETATALLSAEVRDHLWDELVALKSRIVSASSVDEKLRGWSQGILGDKTFQQVTEEFAAMVIPKVWAREGKKIIRVSQKLGMSPKKVRRVLRNAGVVT